MLLPAETWQKAKVLGDGPDLEPQPDEGAKFAPLPAELSRPKQYTDSPLR